jgi:RNA polymerase sigma factor (TIGR02999 family)
MSNQLQNGIDTGRREEDSVPERIAVDVDEVFERLYDRIRCLASRVRWSGTNPTLNPTALAHEAYLKLRRDPPDLASKSYEEVIGIFANAMHQVLLDAARRKSARKRVPVNLPESIELPVEDALTIAEALEKLESENPRQVQVVRCRFLLGMTAAETAAALHIGARTVEREWQEARAGLSRKLEPAKE